ncbi:chemotaxis-specific protein-glutamate methyltransferase CheB [Borrelia miyamotoi]|uniref:protein-glutamate methylesterase n=1 Tax=Borrelia miyamotoi TaxID=47466 RepID=A0AAQ2WVS6_9SPIR|nr:chemotaxis-specific protein-glutamate methyltransferase CheB [Borrelia miyamotoi]AGT27390.1 chemotaxis protein CheY [Borrelia miyamotoi LB-2001]AJA58569.1 chemotaxis protein CheY [Borrelia miyamotoi]AOW95648.1 chemotaxis response regulator protein-glutamate methylesterase [Borrelia miyamotoi]QTL83533.1 chemotaxis protein CheB [Borrelia miyamotoi]WAZ85166.1 chemotaxis protein CheB [Borrelia miyamotoi]
MQIKIYVLIIEASSINRKAISDIINSSSNLEVIATAANGDFALKKLKKHPDVILLSLETETIKEISFINKKKNIIDKLPVIILSSCQEIAKNALLKGANDFIIKTNNKLECIKDKMINLLSIYGNKTIKNKIITNINLEVKTNKSLTNKNEKDKNSNTIKLTDENLIIKKEKIENKYSNKEAIINEKDLKKLKSRKFEIVVIGISTGGPAALKKILPEIPNNFPVPIVIVQHMPKGFTSEFAKNLNNICNLIVKETTNQEILKKGFIYISSGGYHTRINKTNGNYKTEVFDAENVNGHKPSIGVLFKSISENVKEKAIALIMTGMGSDGSREIGEIKKAGGLTIAQDEQSSVVFGMPKIAIEENNIDYIVSINHVIKLLKAILLDG